MCIHRIPIMCFHNILCDLHTYMHSRMNSSAYCRIPVTCTMYPAQQRETTTIRMKIVSLLEKMCPSHLPLFPKFFPFDRQDKTTFSVMCFIHDKKIKKSTVTLLYSLAYKKILHLIGR